MSGGAGIHRRNKLETGWIGYFARVRERWICPDSIGSPKASSVRRSNSGSSSEKARRYAPTKFHLALELHHRPPSQLTTHCDEVSGTGAAAIVFVLIQHLPDLISQRSQCLFIA